MHKAGLGCSCLFAILEFFPVCSLCKDEAITEAPSPDNLRTAVVFYRNCGATTSDYGHVVVRPTSNTSSEGEHTITIPSPCPSTASPAFQSLRSSCTFPLTERPSS